MRIGGFIHEQSERFDLQIFKISCFYGRDEIDAVMLCLSWRFMTRDALVR